jgi:biotin carboxyl carrier protein
MKYLPVPKGVDHAKVVMSPMPGSIVEIKVEVG